MKTNNRRSFLHKLGSTIGAAITLPGMSAASEMIHNKEKKRTDMAVLTIKPLGFVWETKDPFLFCVHHDDKFPKGNEHCGPAVSLAGRNIGQDFVPKDGWRMYHGRTVPGFPSHPHKGFETVTVVRKGLVDHADSMGAAGRYGNGDVQWMTAGKGVQHSEMFPLLKQNEENPLELFQIWLNLPTKGKKANPYFMMMWAESIPRPVFKDVAGKTTETEVIIGSLLGKTAPTPPPESWAANPENEVGLWILKMEPGARFALPSASAYVNRMIYFYEGNGLYINQTPIKPYHAAEVLPNGSVELFNSGTTDAKILVLQGKPIGEPVVQHGPFVMNSIEEIQQAFADFQRTQFGGWPWPKSDQVHPKHLGRFARHADGTEEYKG